MRTFAAKVGPVEMSITSIDSLIAIVPYLLGFVPTRSVVCLWTVDKRISLTMRVDLPVKRPDFDSNAWAHQLLRCGDHSGGTDIHILIFDDERSLKHGPALIESATRQGLYLDTLVTVSEHRRFEEDCIECASLNCSGHEVSPPVSDLRKINELLPTPAASRGEVLAEINEVSNPHIGDLLASESAHYATSRTTGNGTRMCEKWRDESIALIRREWGLSVSPNKPFPPSTPELARAIVALNDVRCRDAVLWLVARPEAHLEQMANYLVNVVVNSPTHLVAGPASVLAAVRWLQGDGLRAMGACQRALDAAPDYTLALLIESALGAGLPPVFWLDTMRALSYEQCRARPRTRPSKYKESDAAMST